MPRKTKAMEPNDPMVLLAQSLAEERAEKALEKRNKRLAQEQALRQHEQSEKAREASDARRAELCDHLLGNHGVGVIPDIRRSALNKHQLSNKEVYIRCQKCRFEWRPKDTDKLWHRWEGGEGTPERILVAYPNPTKMGWNKVNRLFYSFRNATDLTSRAFRIERVEPETFDDEPEPVTI